MRTMAIRSRPIQALSLLCRYRLSLYIAVRSNRCPARVSNPVERVSPSATHRTHAAVLPNACHQQALVHMLLLLLQFGIKTTTVLVVTIVVVIANDEFFLDTFFLLLPSVTVNRLGYKCIACATVRLV